MFRKFFFDIVFSSGAGVAVSALNYYFNVLLAQRLTEKDFGDFNAVVGILYLIQIPATTIISSITKFVAENLDENLESFRTRNIKFFLFLGFIVGAIIAAISPLIAESLDVPFKLVILISFISFNSVFAPLPKGLLMGMQKIKLVNIINLFEAIIKVGFILMIFNFEPTPEMAMLAIAIPGFITGIAIMPFIKLPKISKPALSSNLNIRESLVMLFTYLTFNLGFTLDLMLVDSSYRGAYSALSLVGKVVYFATVFINGVVFASVAKEKSPKKRNQLFFIAIGLNLLGSASVVIVYYIFGDLITEIMFEGRYQEVTQYAVIYGIGMGLYSATSLMMNYLLNLEKKLQVIVFISVALLQVALYSQRNSTLSDAVSNQVIVFSTYFVFTSTYLTYELLIPHRV